MREDVKEYYGKTLAGSEDLKTDACCTLEAPPQNIREIQKKIHPEVSGHYYGCGLIIPQEINGLRILDLGSGSGMDVYTLSAMVGKSGYIVGVDMTDEQLAIARRHREYHAEAFGYEQSNVEFHKGYLEQLDELNLEPGSFDLIVSNCVINLCQDKEAVLKHCHRLLKEGGEMYFSDVYSDRRVPESLRQDPELYGECLSGALYWNDFHNLAKNCGFADPRLVEDRPLGLNNDSVIERIGHIGFYSATYRLFKIDDLEPACEDYGQAVKYLGGIEEQEQQFTLDKHHLIEKGRLFPVCGNTYRMLNESRFAKYFEFYGSWDQHFGIFEGCGSSLPYDRVAAPNESDSGGGCC
ncbi:methyltransferase domain-containing protein [Pseudoteredinibacter isoporae]|uniref:Arsenite methyltransferase n=1 Tax=Pseudoteredinibacter isoporae TaxID=570281 RepID=A0A7X0MWZ3_9GAMM|nr:methyltransferase domain-containing protein [Pseudoteredinibacter isoporae]MBB6522933.1 ubiquinone/menaquinone biosynthesis C-methylase UbiE [Pseudoteredinibacter isoporae]NHO88459.1 methyltransferase domain-containing protein [Pseudoteredinibacter isoporae]NIB22144.1 methyltransferase domain-containing protein [Pseudoteredinibacter isoporae]